MVLKQQGNDTTTSASTSDDTLRRLAFDNSLQANIITTAHNGKIVMVNSAACKLLGYSKKELLTQYSESIFQHEDTEFKRTTKKRNAQQHSIVFVNVVRKNGKLLPCHVISAVFMDGGVKKAITSILNLTESILKQKNIDSKKEKIVADNIALVQSKQKEQDKKNKRIVEVNIARVQSKQKKLDKKNEKIVAANISLVRAKQKTIDSDNEKIVSDNIALAQSKQKTIDSNNEKIVSDNIAIVQSQQKIIDKKNEKATSDNIIEALAKSDARLAENNEWIKYIAKASYDVMWDWDIASGELYLGDSIEEVFGYKVLKNTMQFTEFFGHLLPGEREKVKKKLLRTTNSASKTWNDAFLFRRNDGSVASTVSRASIIRDKKGKAIRLIGAIQDISKLQELEKLVAEQVILRHQQKGIFQLAAKLSYDGIWDWNLVTNDFFLGEGFRDLFGYSVKTGTGSMADWSKHLHPDDKEAVEKGLYDAISSTASRWEHTYRFIRANGSVAEVFGRANILRDSNGKAIRMIGAVHDISKQQVLEAKLEHEIKLTEIRIAEASKDAKDTERSDIGKELHDNVNQLLGASKMYLDLAKGGGDNSALFMSRSSEYMINAIEEIRKLTKGLTTDVINNLGLCVAIDNITHDMMQMNPVRITCSLKTFIENSVSNKFKLNIYRIIQEHLNNILKHAKAMKIAILLAQNKNSVTLKISDNGVGFDTTRNRKGIGLDNIKSRATSYNGKANFISQPGAGCVLNITFPMPAFIAN